jgi:hypothetical protein
MAEMKYKDFFLHLQERQNSAESRIEELAEKLSETSDVSVVRALSAIQDSPSVLKEWKEMGSDAEPEDLLDRIKDSANAPSVGDEVKIQFDEASRGFLTPRQENVNGETGVVKERQEFKTGSQLSRYTVEIKGEEGPHRIHNLTPGEVVPTEE